MLNIEITIFYFLLHLLMRNKNYNIELTALKLIEEIKENILLKLSYGNVLDRASKPQQLARQ